MTQNKIRETTVSVNEFILAVAQERKRADSFRLVELMKEISGFEPRLWGPSIIGFGSYHYKYPSGHEGDAPLIGFSPRKAAISLYVFTGLDEHSHLLEGLGKFKTGKSCIYINKIDDIDTEKLRSLMKTTIAWLHQKYGKQ